MTTEELIEQLKKFPGKRVIIDGYEAGYDDVGRIVLKEIAIDEHLEIGCFGPHGDADYSLSENPRETAVLIKCPESGSQG